MMIKLLHALQLVTRRGLCGAITQIQVAALLASINALAWSQEQGFEAVLEPTLLIISIDGARHDYLELHEAPALASLARHSLRVNAMQPVFPTKTFTNHYSLVTGLLPRNHGIVDNNMYDARMGLRFSLGNREQVQNPDWWGGEPIWVTAIKQGMVAGTFFFPGSEAAVQGISPNYWFTYDESITNRERVDTILMWLAKPVSERPQVMTLYFSDVDTAGHNHGPESPEVAQALADVDAEIGYLLEQLETRQWLDQMNIMITSDHGMASVDLNKHAIIDEAFDTALAEQILYSREMVSIFPLPGNQDEIVAQLTAALPTTAIVYTQETLPARFEFSGHHRIAPVLVLAESGTTLLRRSWLDGFIQEDSLNTIRGGHGYDNQDTDMQALFFAVGPAFKAPGQIDQLRMIDIYNVMAAILNLTPAANDGDPAVVELMLKP
jgi:predicted AlkP superfamily pyrophosphatase or phosphodiesterase